MEIRARQWIALGLLSVTCVVASGAEHHKSPVRKVRLAIILCTFLDKPAPTRFKRFYVDYYTRRGTGGAADYWSDVTFGAIGSDDPGFIVQDDKRSSLHSVISVAKNL